MSAALNYTDISSNGTFAVHRREEQHQIRTSWETGAQCLCLPGLRLMRHTVKQKLKHLRILYQNLFCLQPLNTLEVIDGFQYDTSGNWHITVAYYRLQVSAFCEFGPKFIRKPSSQNSESLNFSAAPFKKVTSSQTSCCKLCRMFYSNLFKNCFSV